MNNNNNSIRYVYEEIFPEYLGSKTSEYEFFYNDNMDINKNFSKKTIYDKDENEFFHDKNRFFIDPPTSYITNNENKIKKSKAIFFIKKVKKIKKKKGRRKRKDIIYDKDNKNYHSKIKEDNIIQKIKVIFIHSTMVFINRRYKDFQKKLGKSEKRFLGKIKSEFAFTIKKEKNIRFLETKLKELFSSDLSEKFFKLNKDYNRHQIEELYKKNEAKEVIEIMEKTVEELMNSYINGDYEKEGFYIENDLSKEKEKMKSNGEDDILEYGDNFLKIAKNFRNIFSKKISRRKLKKNKINDLM